MRVQVFIDESGSIHPNSKDKHMVIGGFFTDDESYKDIKIRYKNIVNKMMNKRKFVGELKASLMKNDEKIAIFEVMQTKNDYLGAAVIFEKEKYQDLVCSSVDGKPAKNHISELFFNYAIFLLVNHTIIPFIDRLQLMDKLEGIDLHIDDRNLAVSSIKSLETLLNTVFLFERYDFKVHYYESKSYSNIQFADLIVNTIYLQSANSEKIKDISDILDSRYVIKEL